MDITKIIRTVFRADTDQFSRAMRSAKGSTDAAIGGIEKLHKRLDGLRNLLAGGALTFGIGKLVSGLININRNAETTRVGMATLIQSTERFVGNNMKFATALERSASVMAKLRKEAIDTPGTLQQVAEAFQTVYMRARGAGLSEDEIVKFAGNIATQDAMMGGKGVVSRDVEQLLRGEAGDVATPQLAIIKKRIAGLVQRGKMQQAAKEIVTALDLDPEARKAAGQTFDGQLSSAKDKLEEIAMIAGKPLFEELNKGLTEMLKWLDKNKARVNEIAEKVGKGLVDAFKFLVKAVEAVGDAIQFIVDNPIAAFIAAIPLLYAAFTSLAAHPLFAALAALGSLFMTVKAYGAVGEAVTNPDLAAAKLFGIKDQKELDANRRQTGINDEALSVLKSMQRAGYDPAAHPNMSDSELGALQQRADAIARAQGVNAMRPDLAESVLRVRAGAGQLDPADAQVYAQVAWERARRVREAYNIGFLGPHEGQEYTEDMRLSMERRLRLEREVGYLQDSQEYRLREAEINRELFDTPGFTIPEKALTKAEINVDARGSKVIQTVKLQTNDPSRLTSVGLMSAFTHVAARPLSGRMGLGSVGLATGR